MTTLRGKRYGEVLLVTIGPDGPQATVYNTYPRYWLMDAIVKDMGADREIATFGGLDMYRQAVVTLSSMNPAPYVANTVARNAVFVFDAEQPIFELLDPDGGHWVMQTWSQIIDPALSYDDLPRLADRLDMPDGWSYRTRTLSEPLRVDTSSQAAQVLQDDLTNSYSLVR